jgi:4-diphosphocytidyl-2-C-methyl-D-erythritol kinase
VHVEPAPAKLTVSLRVTGVRADGYHLIDAEMVSLDHGDRLEIGEGDGLEVVGPFAAGVPTGEENLVRRALAATGRRAHVRLDKRVPAGAGLGGGSADAAAVLRWAGCDDLALAAGLGADVAFCLVGGRARVGGIGEVVEPLPFLARAFTLLVPPLHVDTARVYRIWDDLGGPAAPDGSANDLEQAALAAVPALAGWRDRLARATGRRPHLAGSGGSWFVEGEFPGEGRIVARALERRAPGERRSR